MFLPSLPVVENDDVEYLCTFTAAAKMEKIRTKPCWGRHDEQNLPLNVNLFGVSVH